MTRDEIKINIDKIKEQIEQLEQSQMQSYAELGWKVMPELPEGTHAELVQQIKASERTLSDLRNDQASLETEYQERIIAQTCLYCDSVNSDDSAFCEECGKKLGEKPKGYCDECKTRNNPEQRFCGQCGARLPE